MKDLKQIVSTYLSVWDGDSPPKAIYFGENDEVLELLNEGCAVVPRESSEEYSVGTHSTECDLLVLDGKPEGDFSHLVPRAEAVVYVGPNVGPRGGLRHFMDWTPGIRDAYSIYITPQRAVIYSHGGIIGALKETLNTTTRPPDAVWSTTTTTGPVSPEEEAAPNGWRPTTDNPENPVNTTIPPRDFFSMGQ